MNDAFTGIFGSDLTLYLPYVTIIFYLSIFCFLATLTSAILIVYYLPHDHFIPTRKAAELNGKSSVFFRIIIMPIKNILGICLLLLGLLLLVLPGQGLITILIAVLLLDFPGKQALKFKLVANMQVRRSLNWMRVVLGKDPFAF